MPAVLDNRLCQACGDRHTLCHPGIDVLRYTNEYEYDCPISGVTVRIPRNNVWNRVETVCPLGGVPLRDAK